MADRRTRDPQTLVWSDDNAVMKTIQATHGLDDFTFKIRPLLLVIEDIMSLTAHKRDDIQDIRDKRTGFLNEIDLGDISMQEKLVLEINNISWEILSNCGDGENMHKTVLDVFNALSSFFWAGKAVIALAAFAVNYGEFWLVKQLQSTNPVAQSLAFLEQLQPEMEQTLMFQNMDKLIKAVLNLTKCICESVDVQSNNYLKPDLPELKSMMAKIPEYTYWIIRSIVTCQTQLSNLNAYENVDVYGKLKKLLEVTSNKDNVMILKALISDQEETPLYDGHTNTQAREGKFICLYGGEDTVWIQNFTTAVSDIFQQSQVPIMMLYLGTNDTNAIVEQKNYSNIILDPMKIKLFWARLESIRQSRVQIGVLPESDEIIKEVFKMLSFGCSKRGWAIISKGSKEMAKGMGDIMLKALSEYDQWKGNVELKGFVNALEEYMGTIGTSYFCNKFIVPKTKNGLPEKMDCFECRREMRMSVRFTCCGD
ncbi:hypothetical protein DH2020_031400 [Rehmannia glutinosa]|uniref:Protein SIEVE ELEMENT OCCLUSION B-like n=1 Tax=Rehmannia glutinosa TaxID=99300 RepID=A0ABR0VI60_REHGL